jgi:hypothetical protein
LKRKYGDRSEWSRKANEARSIKLLAPERRRIALLAARARWNGA